MGLPIRKLICASNSNNILTEFINTGHYHLSSRQLMQTSSPAIDILRSSNLERYIHAATNRSSNEVCRLYRDLDETGKFRVSSQVRCSHQTSHLWSIYSENGSYLIDPKRSGYNMPACMTLSFCVSNWLCLLFY